eukprot:scaffold15405_cov119-Isochrysis_galbana.AAC.8
MPLGRAHPPWPPNVQAQFAKLMADGEKLGRQQDPEMQLRDAFNLFDKDGDGKISKKEMVKPCPSATPRGKGRVVGPN